VLLVCSVLLILLRTRCLGIAENLGLGRPGTSGRPDRAAHGPLNPATTVYFDRFSGI
jgi:hypothetical protein